MNEFIRIQNDKTNIQFISFNIFLLFFLTFTERTVVESSCLNYSNILNHVKLTMCAQCRWYNSDFVFWKDPKSVFIHWNSKTDEPTKRLIWILFTVTKIIIRYYRIDKEIFLNNMMKLFQIVCNSFEVLGIHPRQLNQKYRLNVKILKIYVLYCINTILIGVSLFHNDHNFEEYADTIFRISLSILFTICYTIMIFKVRKFFSILDMCEKIIDKSK